MSTERTISLFGHGLKSCGWAPVIEMISVFYPESTNIIFGLPDKGMVDACILLNLQTILPISDLCKITGGSVLFHSSDLPKGRGWAPTYNTVMQKTSLTQTALEVSEKVDSGRIYAKATYPLEHIELSAEIEKIDERLTLLLLEYLLPHIFELKGKGLAQNEKDATYAPRRYKSDSLIDARTSVQSLFDFLRALPEDAPAFFFHRGRKYILRIEVESSDEIVFDSKKVEIEKFL